MTGDARMRAVFDALARDDMPELLEHWADDGVYFNPTMGPPAEGKQYVGEVVGRLSKGLIERGERLVVDNVTEVNNRAFVEWHVEGPSASRLGVHAVTFDSAGLLRRVVVFAHPAPTI